MYCYAFIFWSEAINRDVITVGLEGEAFKMCHCSSVICSLMLITSSFGFCCSSVLLLQEVPAVLLEGQRLVHYLCCPRAVDVLSCCRRNTRPGTQFVTGKE